MTSTLTIFLSFSLIVLIATKVADIWTTHRGIVKAAGRCDLEQNPIARYAMKRWGLWQTYSFISILWLMIVAFCYYPALSCSLVVSTSHCAGRHRRRLCPGRRRSRQSHRQEFFSHTIPLTLLPIISITS